MKGLLKYPAVNAVCISLFSAFYGLIFIITSGHIEFKSLLYYSRAAKIYPFWTAWSSFLASGHHVYIAFALIVITMLVVLMLLIRRRPYDEYHTANLIQCLVVAAILTLIAIAVFYLMILSDPNGIVEKFTLFIVINWTTVVLADLVFVLVCRWR
jgi:hypothetical protein